jgi:hypothetical protein
VLLGFAGRGFVAVQLIHDLYLPLSQTRLEAYRPPTGSDLEMLTNYFWNIALAEGLVPTLHAVELALRNTIHQALATRYGTDLWFSQSGVLGSGQLIEFNTAYRRVLRKPPVTAGKLVAELNFGFWVTLLSGPYEQTLWRPNWYALLRTAFPHVANSRKHIHDRFNAIRLLRNRVFHHEAIWHRPNLPQEHADIHAAIGWISPTLHAAIQAVDNFPANFGGKARVEADLKARLGIA